jgi:hypothetical protein
MSDPQDELGRFADELVSLPRRYRKQKTVSIYELLGRTGYFERRDTLSLEAVRTALAKNPESLEEWLEYSQDKRTGSGWYLRGESGRFEVAHLQADGRVADERLYTNLEEACANFVLRELAEIASD